MSGDYRFEQDSFYAYKGRVDHARVSGCNCHPNGLKKTYTTPEGMTYTYYYDVQGSTSAEGAGRAGTANKNNQFTAVHIPGSGQLSRGSFYWLQPQTLLLPGGSQVTLSYDDFLQVKERILQDPTQTNVAQAIYDYDAVGDITAIDTEHGDYGFDYDSLYRLTDVDYPTTVAANDETFGYDGVGNRTTHTETPEAGEQQTASATYNNLNQLVSQTQDGVETTFTYNTNGHTATKTTGSGTTEYIYNLEERLIAVKKNGITVGEYAYNPLGQRIKKTVNGQTTWYLYNDEGLAAEYNQQGQLIAEYHFTPYSTWMTDPLFQRRGGQVYYYQNDHLGTPQRMINANGEVVWEARYSAFGEAEIINEAVTNNLRFPGQYFDGESGLHHNYFRDYDPNVGRYVQGDPIGLDGGINQYLYALSSPLYYSDPFGLKGLFTTRGRSPSRDRFGTIVCDGKGGVKPWINDSVLGNMNPQGKKCIVDCATVHEQVHVDQVNADSPELCSGVAKDIEIGLSFPSNELKSQIELPAYYAERDCLRKKKRQECVDDDCKEAVSDRIDSVNQYISEYGGVAPPPSSSPPPY